MKKFINQFEVYLGAFCSGLMVLILFAQVVARYVFNNAFSWAEELSLILFILSIYFGATGAILRNQHLRLSVLLDKLKPKTRLIFDIMNNLIFMLFNVVILYGIFPIVLKLQENGTSTAVLSIPKWMIYAVLPFLFVLMIIRLVQDCIIKVKKFKAPSDGELSQ